VATPVPLSLRILGSDLGIPERVRLPEDWYKARLNLPGAINFLRRRQMKNPAAPDMDVFWRRRVTLSHVLRFGCVGENRQRLP
jgi:hypothetical protein